MQEVCGLGYSLPTKIFIIPSFVELRRVPFYGSMFNPDLLTGTCPGG
jgi:hypothetical protein